MNVIPGDDILHARSHGGTNGEDKALFKGPAQQAQHTVPLGAVREVGHAVCSRVPNTWVGVFWLLATKDKTHPFNDYKQLSVGFWNILTYYNDCVPTTTSVYL